MSNVSHLMKEYFGEPKSKKSVFGLIVEAQDTMPQGLPVKPDKFEWQILKDPERYYRKFDFEDRQRMTDFINDILDFEDDLGHHSQLTISHKSVEVEVNTKTLESITNLDQEYVKGVDEIYQDVEFYRYKK